MGDDRRCLRKLCGNPMSFLKHTSHFFKPLWRPTDSCTWHAACLRLQLKECPANSNKRKTEGSLLRHVAVNARQGNLKRKLGGINYIATK
jgi:hypothetical protein